VEFERGAFVECKCKTSVEIECGTLVKCKRAALVECQCGAFVECECEALSNVRVEHCWKVTDWENENTLVNILQFLLCPPHFQHNAALFPQYHR
jgi:hypothetical protein